MLASVEGYEAAREYEEINIWNEMLTDRGGATLRQADIQYDPNFCAVVIDSFANKMVINAIVGATDAETALAEEVWRANKMDLFFPAWKRRSLRDGDGYLLVWPRADSAPESEMVDDQESMVGADGALTGPLTPEQVNIVYVDPECGRMMYDAEDPRRKECFCQLWWDLAPSGEGRVWRMNMIFPDRIERYATKPLASEHGLKAEDFAPWVEGFGRLDGYTEDQLVEDGVSWPEDNPYGVIPVYHLRTDIEYGRPVHRNAFGLQDAISRLVEIGMTTVNFAAWPQRYALQEADSFGTQTVREDPLSDVYPGTPDFDDVSSVSLPTGAITNETGSDLEATPGGIMVLKNFRDVKEFNAADPNAYLLPLDQYIKMIASTCGVPLWNFQGIGASAPAGVALDIATEPLVAHVESFNTLFGAEVEEMLAFALMLCGAPQATIEVHWRSARIEDETVRWALVKARVDAGVPLKEALMMAGISEKEAERWAAEKEQAAERARQDMLNNSQPGSAGPGIGKES
jgi:hypothetical protein